jgi:hypothetical protein
MPCVSLTRSSLRIDSCIETLPQLRTTVKCEHSVLRARALHRTCMYVDRGERYAFIHEDKCNNDIAISASLCYDRDRMYARMIGCLSVCHSA